MKRNFAIIAMAGLALGPAAASDYFVYHGDFDGYAGLACERNTQVSDARIYDNFVLSEPTRVRGLWGNYFVTGLTSTQAYFEIRQGVAEHNPGTLIVSGTADALYAPTGRNAWGLQEIHGRIGVPEFVLEAGEYWLTVAPIGDGRGRSFGSSTDGANRGPTQDPNPAPKAFRHDLESYFDSFFFGFVFEPVRNVLGADTDWSYGVGTLSDNLGFYSYAYGFSVLRGRHLGGDLAELWSSDDRRLVLGQLYPFSASGASAQLTAWSQTAGPSTGGISIRYESRCSASPSSRVVERVELYNYVAGVWETVSELPGSPGDRTTDVSVGQDAGRFVEPITNEASVRIGWFDRGVLNLGWTAQVDYVRFFVRR